VSPPMSLSMLRLHQFRCFSAMQCDLADGINLFTGDNAQGKTSVLEAVCVLLRLQSPRAAGASELVEFGRQGFGIRGGLGEAELTHSWTSSGKRKLSLNGETCRKAGDYLGSSGLVVWMGSEDLLLVRGGSDARRRYLDFVGFQWYPDYRVALRSYEKALRSRNFLLKRDASPNWKQIDAYSEVLVRYGTVLTARRSELVEMLAPLAAEGHHSVGGGSEALAIAYSPGAGEGDFATNLEDSQADEQRRRLTLVGPHRDDFRMEIDGRAAGQFASEGQHRTVALALKLAQSNLLGSRRGSSPILLIDDVFGELDSTRRNALLAALPAGAQKLITTTNVDWLREETMEHTPIGAHFSVNEGMLERHG
jgi:DNA replication and repair protein RecF